MFLIIQNKMYIWISIIINYNISLRKRSIFSTYSFLILYNHLNLTIKYNSSYFNTYQILYSNFYLLYEILFILLYNLSFLCVHLMYIYNVHNLTFTYIIVINIYIFMQKFICYLYKTNTCKNIYQGIYFY